MPLTTRKKKVTRAAPRRGAKLQSPSWDGCEKWSGEKYHRFKQSARSFYYENYKASDLYPYLFTWMQKNDYTKTQIKSAKACPDWRIGVHVAINARLVLDGMLDYYKPEDDYWQSLAGTGGVVSPVSDYLKRHVDELIEYGKDLVAEKEAAAKAEAEANKNIYKPSIQELLRNKAYSMTDDFEEFIDEFDYKKSTLQTFKPLNILKKYQAKANHATIIRRIYAEILQEWEMLVNPPKLRGLTERERNDLEQLQEGYENFSKTEIKSGYELYKGIVDACDMIIETQKATRKPRKKKVVSADKQVAKLKYCKEHVDTGSVSINPTQIIGAAVLLTYNTKTRKIGIYYATNPDPTGMGREGSGFSVKGTTLQGFIENASVQKTLRKPQEQLPLFKKVTRRSLEKTFGAIKSVETKMNGRINEHTIILKVFDK